ncbi:MAG: PIN domain nuclease [Proteobacteria bacterium]|nr:MAG: PIN domain nuclease [Pseudomonadota bacterium]
MRLLLDTRAFLWWDTHDTRLPDTHRLAIESPRNEVFVSAATVWEIAIKRSSGKLAFGMSVAKAIEQHRFISLPITVDHAEGAGSLPQLHRDPFDRLLVAQAQLEGLILVTVDDQILRYAVPHL